MPDATVENVQTVLELDRRARAQRSGSARLSERITRITGTATFAAGNVALLGIWIVLNLTTRAFDPFPFSLLTLILSVEAILLSIFVLMSENQMAREAERRAQLDLQINLLAEQELTAALVMLRGLCQHAGINVEISDAKLRAFVQETRVDRLADEIDAEMTEESSPGTSLALSTDRESDMSSKTENVGNDPTIMGNEKPRRDPEGKEGAGAHQEGPGSKQTGQSDRMSKSGRLESGDLRQGEHGPNGDRGQGDKTSRSSSGEQGMSNRPNEEDDNETDNGGQKTVQGKKQSGPDDKIGRSAGGNEGSKGQNANRQGDQQHAGHESRDQGERGHQGGSGGGQGNRQNKETKPSGSTPSGNKPKTN